MRRPLATGLIIAITLAASAAFAQPPASQPHNVVLFVADGLRSCMVDDATAPAMAGIARDGVSLRNSHALFPDVHHRECVRHGDRPHAGGHG